MATLIFRLNNVPDDELAEVRELLDANDIDYYQTPAGKWGISSPGLWLRDDAQLDTARELLERYHRERAERMREDYRRRQREGAAEGLLDELRARPLRFILYLAAALLILYLSVVPFFRMSV